MVTKLWFQIKTKDLSKELSHKPTYFVDCGKIFDFLPNLRFFEAHLRVFKIVGNRQTQKNFIFTKLKNACTLRFISLTTHKNDK